jgi:hypothetical protein
LRDLATVAISGIGGNLHDASAQYDWKPILAAQA